MRDKNPKLPSDCEKSYVIKMYTLLLHRGENDGT